MQRKNLNFFLGVNFDLIENLPNNWTKYLLIFDDSCEEISNSKQFVIIATAGRHRGLNSIYIYQTQFISSKQIRKRYRVTKYTHSLVQVAEGCLTNQYIKSTTRSRISIEIVTRTLYKLSEK